MRRSIPAFLSTCSLVVGVALLGFGSIAAEADTTGTSTSSDTGSVLTGRVIVKFKSGSSLLMQSAGQAEAPQRAKALGVRTGMSIQGGHAISETMQVVTATGVSSTQLAARLAKESDVEFAVEDERRFKTEVPNDTYYPPNVTGAPLAAGQWYLKPPTTAIPASINAEPAWDLTTGSSSVVVAVLDSGVRYDHPDLTANLLPGYDMITNVATANDGDGRDSDASDPGDWVTTAESTTNGGSFAGCSVEDSSWHGTQVSGLISASTDNNYGMASVGRNVKILPVRVLGKCGGYDSDIVAGMRWAVGLQVGTLPINPYPAKVINMSLGSGGSGACTSAYISAVADVTNAGALIVASAGNSAGHSVGTPANCTGVLAVAGLRHIGTKVGYSDLGSQIGISAPAGNCVASTGTCQYPILTSTNPGTTTPTALSSATDPTTIFTGGGNNASLGTSFSAPLVSATAALVWSIQPGLTSAQVLQILKTSARAFPTTGADSTVSTCTAPTGADQLECYCTTSTCGAGMLDAGAATAMAVSGLTTASTGTTTTTTTPTTTASTDSGGGGGALDPQWLACLALAVVALRISRRRPSD